MAVEKIVYHYRWNSGRSIRGSCGALFSSASDSLSQRTSNWLGEKEGEAPVGAGTWPCFRFGRSAG
jgi:hypothetical protein